MTEVTDIIANNWRSIGRGHGSGHRDRRLEGVFIGAQSAALIICKNPVALGMMGAGLNREVSRK